MELKIRHSTSPHPTIITISSSLFPKNLSLLAQHHSNGSKSHETQSPKPLLSLEFCSRKLNQLLKVPSAHHLSLAKTSGPFLVLVPLVAICLGCIISSFLSRISKNIRQAAKKSGMHNRAPNNMRWKTVLGDKDPDAPDTEFEPNFDHFSEEQEYLAFEAKSHDYTKVEADYQKFLSECGMSSWGDWRGGSPE